VYLIGRVKGFEKPQQGGLFSSPTTLSLLPSVLPPVLSAFCEQRCASFDDIAIFSSRLG
jgi:hypothetical protein